MKTKKMRLRKAATVKQALIAARWILENKKLAWTKGALWRLNGEDVGTKEVDGKVVPNGPVDSCCAIGALRLCEVESKDIFYNAWNVLDASAQEISGVSWFDTAYFNDQHEGLEDVLYLFDKAIEKAGDK